MNEQLFCPGCHRPIEQCDTLSECRDRLDLAENLRRTSEVRPFGRCPSAADGRWRTWRRHLVEWPFGLRRLF